jgi:histone arginine demethylase JMJD6
MKLLSALNKFLLSFLSLSLFIWWSKRLQVGEKRRPPYRWFLMGPKRSGTCVHIDPLGSSAWNTVVSGKKLWVLFPPGTPKSVVKAKRQILPDEDDEAINFFIDLIPRLKRDYPTLDVYQFIQGPGDTVFIPGGWWHAVLNLEDSIAITQNYCSKQNFDKVWKETRTGRKKMALKWLRCLRDQHPDLARRAEQLNEEDGFVMPFDKKIQLNPDGEEDDSEDRGRKSKKDKKSKKSKSSSSDSSYRSRSRDTADRVPNDDGRKKHESVLDNGERAPAAESDDECDSDNSKSNKRKIAQVAGALARSVV